jgi:hypothetical protein
MESHMDKHAQVAVTVATWWETESQRDFTRLECGLLGALFSAIGIGFVLTVGALWI